METEITPSAIFFDYHSHHYRCGHAVGNMVDYVEQAMACRMVAFGVSDHGPAYWLPGDHDQPQTQMAKSEVSHYVGEAQEVKARYAGRIDVQVGIEADYIEGQEQILSDLLNAHPLDYVLGSVHYAFGRNIFAPSRWQHDTAEVYAEYYRLVAKAAASGMFDILSHLTAVESYAPPPSEELTNRLYPPVADAIAEAGVIVEINTSGYRKLGGDDPFPNRRMLRLLIERGVPFTFSSDCHRPEEVGFGSHRVRALLIEMGVNVDGVQLTEAGRRLTTERTGRIYTFPTEKSS